MLAESSVDDGDASNHDTLPAETRDVYTVVSKPRLRAASSSISVSEYDSIAESPARSDPIHILSKAILAHENVNADDGYSAPSTQFNVGLSEGVERPTVVSESEYSAPTTQADIELYEASQRAMPSYSVPNKARAASVSSGSSAPRELYSKPRNLRAASIGSGVLPVGPSRAMPTNHSYEDNMLAGPVPVHPASMTRAEAEAVLQNATTTEPFLQSSKVPYLVRAKAQAPGAHVVSLMLPDSFAHQLIEPTANGKHTVSGAGGEYETLASAVAAVVGMLTEKEAVALALDGSVTDAVTQ
jgi:hypothetical protein